MYEYRQTEASRTQTSESATAVAQAATSGSTEESIPFQEYTKEPSYSPTEVTLPAGNGAQSTVPQYNAAYIQEKKKVAASEEPVCTTCSSECTLPTDF